MEGRESPDTQLPDGSHALSFLCLPTSLYLDENFIGTSVKPQKRKRRKETFI